MVDANVMNTLNEESLCDVANKIAIGKKIHVQNANGNCKLLILMYNNALDEDYSFEEKEVIASMLLQTLFTPLPQSS